MNDNLFHGSLVSTQRILYTASDFARENLLFLQETGTLQATSPHTSSREKLASFLFFLVENGEGKLEYEGITYLLKKNDCVFINCNHPYAHYTSEKDLWKLKWAHFNGPTMTQIYGKYLDRANSPVFNIENIDLFLPILNSLFEIAKSSSYTRDMELQEKLSLLLTQIMIFSWDEGNKNTQSKKNLTLFQVKDFLDHHYTEKLSLDLLSQKFYINKYYLTRIFKQQYGQTVSQYILEKRITLAKNLLRFSDKTITQIAFECGFSDSNYFSRVFKLIEKNSPNNFRNHW